MKDQILTEHYCYRLGFHHSFLQFAQHLNQIFNSFQIASIWSFVMFNFKFCASIGRMFEIDHSDVDQFGNFRLRFIAADVGRLQSSFWVFTRGGTWERNRRIPETFWFRIWNRCRRRWKTAVMQMECWL